MYRLKGTAGTVINQSYPISGRLVIGTTPECDVRMRDGGPDNLSVTISLAADGQVDFASSGGVTGIAVNGMATTTGRLEPGDELRIGRCAFLLQAPGIRPERRLGETPPVARLRARLWLVAVLAAAALAVLAWRGGWLA